MRIILTGATGFIGQCLTSLLREAGHDIVCLLRPGTPCPTGVTSIPVDLSQPQTIARLPPSDALIHLAQMGQHLDVLDAAESVFSLNSRSTARLLQLALRNGTQAFVLASSGSVYPGGHDPWQEDAVLSPKASYPTSKVAAETLLSAYARYFHTCALRLFTPYGPRQRNCLVPGLIEQIREQRPIRLDGEAGGLRLSVAYVDDVASSFRAAAEDGWEGAYNVASIESTRIADIANAIGRRLDVLPLFERTGRPEPSAIIADVSRLARVYDVAGFTSLEDGINLTLAGEGLC
jgi:nucleoside-diphosphate-sugar epimerase